MHDLRKSELMVTDKFVVRPVYHRYLRRKHSMKDEEPTELEKADAILVLQDCYPPVFEIDEVLLAEAERIMAEASTAERERNKP